MTITDEKKANEPTGVIKELVEKPTRDMYLAAAYHAEGCELKDVDRTDPTRLVFVFEGGENADRVEREWFSDKLLVIASRYANSIRTVKSLIYASK